MRNVNYEQFLRADLEKFRGLYIAIVDDRVVEAGEETEKIYVKARERYPKKEVVLGRFQRRGAQPITFKYRAEKSKIFGVMKRPVAKV